jgi:putative PIN family toxin of toxin-antitoxin system
VRVVRDTNVRVAAFLFEGRAPHRALMAALDRATVVVSDDLVAEFREVLSRSKFRGRIAPAARDAFLATLLQVASVAVLLERFRVCRDLKDDKSFDAAVAGAADAIVTGDADLLAPDPFRGIAILRPGDFLAELAR